MTTIQSIGFYFGFALQDGVWGDARDTQTTVSKKTSGVYTTQQNAKDIDELCAYAAKNGLAGRSTIIYGDAPGAGYLLDMSPALSSFWPSLPSYSYSDWQRDIAIVESSMDTNNADTNNADTNNADKNSIEYADSTRPVVVVTSGVAAYIDSCNGAVDDASLKDDEKLKDLQRFMKQYGYVKTFSDEQFTVYE